MNLLALTDVEWARLISLIQAASTVTVAILAAWLASRGQTRLQQSQRHFHFRDERAVLYSHFIQKMNGCFGAYWDVVAVDLRYRNGPARKPLEAAALELDTQCYTIQIHAPAFVAAACMQVNGILQHLTTMVDTDADFSDYNQSYEVAKRNMVKAMQRDLAFIEQTASRRDYSKLVAAEDVRYHREIAGKLQLSAARLGRVVSPVCGRVHPPSTVAGG